MISFTTYDYCTSNYKYKQDGLRRDDSRLRLYILSRVVRGAHFFLCEDSLTISISSNIMRNTFIIHIINYSSLQVTRPRYYWRHGSYTSDWAFYIKNPWARRLFIPLLVQMNMGNSPFLAENVQNIQKLTSEFFSK